MPSTLDRIANGKEHTLISGCGIDGAIALRSPASVR